MNREQIKPSRKPTQETVDKWLDQGDAYMRELYKEFGINASDVDWVAASYACTLAYAAGFKAGKETKE